MPPRRPEEAVSPTTPRTGGSRAGLPLPFKLLRHSPRADCWTGFCTRENRGGPDPPGGRGAREWHGVTVRRCRSPGQWLVAPGQRGSVPQSCRTTPCAAEDGGIWWRAHPENCRTARVQRDTFSGKWCTVQVHWRTAPGHRRNAPVHWRNVPVERRDTRLFWRTIPGHRWLAQVHWRDEAVDWRAIPAYRDNILDWCRKGSLIATNRMRAVAMHRLVGAIRRYIATIKDLSATTYRG